MNIHTGGEGDDRGWDGWMASWTRWTWVWVNSGRWWWTGRPGMLWFMGSQRVGHDWATELNWTLHNMGFPGGSDGKEFACDVGDLGSIPGLGRSLGGGRSNPLQYSCLENSHGQRSLAAYSLWCCKDLDMTEQLRTAQDTWVISGLLKLNWIQAISCNFEIMIESMICTLV